MNTDDTTEKPDAPQELASMVELAKISRLSLDQERQTAQLLKASLVGGKSGIEAIIEPLVSLPWVVGVSAVVEAWPELKPAVRKQLLTGLSGQNSDQGRRFLLSLSRGLLPHDSTTALKLAVSVCTEMSAAENNSLTLKDRQIFANVFIGKGKPWILHLPLSELKPDEADTIIHCAVIVCFSGQCPPLTQQSLLSWIAGAGRLGELPAGSIEMIAKAVKRWPTKLQNQLKSEAVDLPSPIVDALQSKPTPETTAPLKQEQAAERRKSESIPRTASQKSSPAGFDVNAALRQIEAHVHSLRGELTQAKSELRRRETGTRGRIRRETLSEPMETNTGSIEELQRHNHQLEETVAELRSQMEDLAAHHEDIAVSIGAHEDNPVTDGREQLKTLLNIKLQKDYAEFLALAQEPPDEVFREHYRLLIENVFQILAEQGIVPRTG